MSLTRILPSDRSGLLAAGGLLAGLPPEAVYIYLLVRLIIPILLIAVAVRGATPVQRISLVRAYLLTSARTRGAVTGAGSIQDPIEPHRGRDRSQLGLADGRRRNHTSSNYGST